MKWWFPAALAVSAILVPLAMTAEPTPARRGEKALTEHAFIPPFWSLEAYKNAWKSWGVKEPPANYDQAFRDHYGLFVPPYANGHLPMGLRESRTLFGKGIATDCMLCHGGAIFGQSIIGLGNSANDVQALFEDLDAADGRHGGMPFTFCNVRGTSEAGGMAVFLLGLRNPDLSLRGKRLDLDLHDDLCEDVPAWWLLKKKKTMYHTGGGDARSVRSLMQFMMHPLNAPRDFDAAEPAFRDVRELLLSLEPPKYPFPIDQQLAGQGGELFEKTCARCHGAYGEHWTYPNRIVPLEEIGTDPTRARGISRKFGEYYNQSWFAHEKGSPSGEGYPALASDGYQAPPLDGLWATAPYFHNGSAPTVYDVLNSKARPKVFTRSYRTEREDYDAHKLGWKVQVLEQGPDPKLPVFERRKVYDTTQPGRGNTGHTFGDKLTDAERWAIIEYLKTL